MHVRRFHVASVLSLTLAFCACGGGGTGGGSGGSPDGSSTGGSTASGGTSTGGQAPSTGGASTGGQAPSTGGASSGGSESGTGGSATGGGSACEDTSSDPDNCGTCGHVCEAQGAECDAGVCPPSYQGCFVEDDGFATCDEYCTSVGETCVARECAGTATAALWPSDMGNQCEEDPYSSSGQSIADCDYPLEFSDSHAFYRCCCTDS